MFTQPNSRPSHVGSLTELAVACALTRAGLAVYLPFFCAHGRVDLVYEKANHGLRRVQCKTGHLRGSVITFYTCSHTGGVEQNYRGDADDFGIYCVENDTVYLVPVADVPTQRARLRVDRPRNNQQRGVRWADDYRLK